MSKNVKSASASSKKSKAVAKTSSLKSQMSNKGKIGQTAQLLQKIRSGNDALVVDKAAVKNIDTEVAGQKLPDLEKYSKQNCSWA